MYSDFLFDTYSLSSIVYRHSCYLALNTAVVLFDASPAYPRSFKVLGLVILILNGMRIFFTDYFTYSFAEAETHQLCILSVCTSVISLCNSSTWTLLIFYTKYTVRMLTKPGQLTMLSVPIGYERSSQQ